jgi:GTP-binding protein HflX
LEVDRREIGRRIAQISEQLEQVRRHRALHRRQRKRQAVPVIAIVGYTNAGKSTLLNTLSGANVLAEDMLFATLDPTTRRVALPHGREVLFSDTVGFIQKLPTQLVAAFRATLEEIAEADLIVHVVDVTHPNSRQQSETVSLTLADLGVVDRPVVLALNKIDRFTGPAEVDAALALHPGGLPVSAKDGTGIAAMLGRIEEILAAELVYITVQVPYEHGDLVSLFHAQGNMVEMTHENQGTVMMGFLPRRWLDTFRPYLI